VEERGRGDINVRAKQIEDTGSTGSGWTGISMVVEKDASGAARETRKRRGSL